MKKNYQSLTKEERKNLRQKYYATSNGKIAKNRFLRLLIFGWACIIYGVIVMLLTLINEDSFWNYIMAFLVLLFGLIFLIGRKKILIRDLNNYLRKNK